MARLVATAIVAAIALSGCITTEPEVEPKVVESSLEAKPAELHSMFRLIVTEGERNHVLHRLRVGLALMERGYNDLAAEEFDEALLTIETIYADDDDARAARSNFTAEDRKVFRGEPYERAMAFYYRGVLYLMEGDYENARASFRSGSLQDTMAEKEEARQDFALLEFLEGWSSQCYGNADLATEAWTLAKESDASVVLPHAGHNLVVLADLGHGPVKYGAGEHDELLKIKGSDKSYEAKPAFRLNATARSLPNRESILRQALTRGGREFDHILEGKAAFKEGAEDVSQAAGAVAEAGVAVGAMGLLSGDEDMTNLGGGMAALGGLMSLFAATVAEETKPEADTRYWDNLPEVVLYGTYQVEPGAADIQGLANRTQEGGDDRCRVAWTRHPTSVTNHGDS